jgi:hypothetical protein
MDRRVELHALLTDLLGSSHVYFQPPETVRLVYPCIIYTFDQYDIKRADNTGYLGKKRYSVTIISKDPDYPLPDRFALLPLCSFNRFYTADNLNHWVYELYF